MFAWLACLTVAALVAGRFTSGSSEQSAGDPFPRPLSNTAHPVHVAITDFAVLPDFEGEPARTMLMIEEPATGRLFVNDMHGLLYLVSNDGQTVSSFLNVFADEWGLKLQADGAERGFQSFAFHPQFGQPGSAGFGKLYTYLDTADTAPEPHFVPGGGNNTHDTILLEWTAINLTAPFYDGGAPRELLRVEQPFGNHNGGQLAFRPGAEPGDADFGLLYVGSADGGSGGDPLDLAQDPGKIFGKILRIDPLGSDSANGQYGVPTDNPYARDDDPSTLGEIYAVGLRNPQRFGWDLATGDLFVADIGQGSVEEISRVTSGANLGWNEWEGSYRYRDGRSVSLTDPRSDAAVTYPMVEFGHRDPLLQRSSAITGLVVYRDDAIPELRGLMLFGDSPTGELFAVAADTASRGGQDAIRRVALSQDGVPTTLLALIQATQVARGRRPSPRADLRLGADARGRIFVLNKRDGRIRVLVRSD